MKKLLIALMLVLAAGSIAFAQSGISIEQDMDSDLVYITVDTGVRERAVAVTLKILDPQDTVNYLNMQYTDAEGKAYFQYSCDMGSGMMRVIAAAGGCQYTEKFLKLGDSEGNTLIGIINTQLNSTNPDGEQVKQAFLQYGQGLDLNWAVFDTLAKPDAVYQIMVQDSGNKGAIKVLADVKNAFYKAVAAQKVNEDAAAVYTLLEDPLYMPLFGGEKSLIVSESRAVSVDVKAYAMTKLNPENTCFAAIADNLEFGFLAGGILKATHWNDVKSRLEAHKEKLGISVVSASTQVYKDMMKQEYGSYAACAAAFNQLKNKYSGTDGTSSRPSGSTGTSSLPGIIPGGSTENSENGSTTQTGGELQKGQPVFSDMEDAKWAIEAVGYTYERGIISGVGDGLFQPNRETTRAEAVKMIIAMIGAEPQDMTLPFVDISPADWCYSYICTAYQMGIVSGKSETEFDANTPISRQEMAVFAYRAMQAMRMQIESGAEVVFEDQDDIASWASEAVGALLKMGIVAGRAGEGGSIFQPTQNITRAESAMIIYQIMKRSV